VILAVAHGPSPLWYATRGTGAVTLLLLTASVVLGVAETRAWRPAGTSLFAVSSLHRTLSLLAITLLAVHIVTTLLDPFPHITALVAVVPFASPYRTLWLGLGTVAADLLLALVVTSLVRRRLGYGAWRGIHWLAYACWPVALLHGLGTGSDPKSAWMLMLTIACVGAVALACATRLAAASAPARARANLHRAPAVRLPQRRPQRRRRRADETDRDTNDAARHDRRRRVPRVARAVEADLKVRLYVRASVSRMNCTQFFTS